MNGERSVPEAWIRRAGRPLRDARRHRVQLAEDRAHWDVEWAVERELDAVTRGSHPVIVGPWLSEVGYETLYWVPFLRWVREAFKLDPSRVVAVSRGGVACWYRGVADRYAEIWDEVSPDAFASRVAERGRVKQVEETPFDRELVARVVARFDLRGARVLHPSLMYRLFGLFWSGQRSLGFLDRHTRYERVEAADMVPLPELPEAFVAVKFYAARSMPDTPAVRTLLARQVVALAEHVPVVLLDTGLVLDEHADYELACSGRVMSARPWMRPSNNLGVQTQIIARARAFVGTCGSVAWLAPMLGVDTAALFVDSKWLHAHLGVALRAAHRVGGGFFAPADLRATAPGVAL